MISNLQVGNMITIADKDYIISEDDLLEMYGNTSGLYLQELKEDDKE